MNCGEIRRARATYRSIDDEEDTKKRKSVEFEMEDEVLVVQEEHKACKEGRAAMLEMTMKRFERDVTREEREAGWIEISEAFGACCVTVEEQLILVENDWAEEEN